MNKYIITFGKFKQMYYEERQEKLLLVLCICLALLGFTNKLIK